MSDTKTCNTADKQNLALLRLEISVLNDKVHATQEDNSKLTSKISTMESVNSALTAQLADAELDFQRVELEKNNTFDALVQAQLQIAELEKKSQSDSGDLKSQITSLTTQLEIATQTKEQVKERNYDQERKLTSVTHQKSVLQEQYDSLRASFNTIHKENIKAKDLIEQYEQEQESNAKLIEQLQGEVAGFPTRLENTRKTEAAKFIGIDTEEVVKLQSVVESKQQEINSLSGQLVIFKKDKTDLNNQVSSLQSEVDKLEATNQALVAHSEQSDLIVKEATTKLQEQIKVSNSVTKQVKEMLQSYSDQTLMFDKQKRENLYLLQMLEYQEMRTLWEHEDGTAVYIIAVNPDRAMCMSDGEVERHSRIHPICWVMNSNGTGHTVVMSEDQTELLYPNAAKGDSLMPLKHQDSILESIKNVTISHFNDALEKAVKRAQNICASADLLDFSWSETLQTDKLIAAIVGRGENLEELVNAQRIVTAFAKHADDHRKSGAKLRKPKKRTKGKK